MGVDIPPEVPLRLLDEVVPVALASEQGVRMAQTMHGSPCIPVGIQQQKAEVGPTAGQRGVCLTWLARGTSLQWRCGALPENPYIITRTAHIEALIVRGTGYDVDIRGE
jgi:hypothetical protein